MRSTLTWTCSVALAIVGCSAPTLPDRTAAPQRTIADCYSLHVLAAPSNAIDLNASGHVLVQGESVAGISNAYVWTRSGVTALPPPPGYETTIPVAINARDEVLGSVWRASAVGIRAAQWRDAVPTVLEITGAETEVPLGMNDSGHVVGRALDGDAWRAFVYRDGAVTALGVHRLVDRGAINNKGDVVLSGTDTSSRYRTLVVRGGTTVELATALFAELTPVGLVCGTFGPTPPRAFLWRDGAPNDLTAGDALGCNDRGEVVGSRIADDGSRVAFLYDGTLTDLGGGAGEAYDVNVHTRVVGWANGSPFVWDRGELGVLPTGELDAAQTRPIKINDDGVIIGVAFDANREPHAMIWLPDRCEPPGEEPME